MFASCTTALARLSLYGLALALLCQCGPRLCQQNDTPVENITDQPFRLIVNGTNPPQQGLNNYNFPILKFNPDFTVRMDTVVNNLQSANPSLTGEYDIVEDDNLIVVQFQPANGGSPFQVRWRYELKRAQGKLTLTDIDRGTVWSLVVFKGIVLPGVKCEFR